MKKTILAITAVILILFIIISACLTSYTRSTNVVHKPTEILDENQQATSAETPENCKEPQDCGETSTSHSQNCNSNDTEEAENTQSVTPNNTCESPLDTSQNENTDENVCPPDGRVYWTSEPPYAYTPTYTPKKWTKLPIMPMK